MSTPADPTKVIGRRVVATLIDGAIVLVPVAAYATSQLTYVTKDQVSSSGQSLQGFCDQYTAQHGNSTCVTLGDNAYYGGFGNAPALLLLGLALAMHVLLQGISGWTIGKLVTGIRCVRDDGSPCGLLKALLRWLLWIVDSLPVFDAVGFIVALTTIGHRRVGDMVAKTYVVRASAAGQPILIAGLTAPPVVAEGAPAWSAGGAPYAPAPAPTAKHGPQWDEARSTYIQWDPTATAWMQWDESARTWNRIPGQGEDQIPPPPPTAPPPTSDLPPPTDPVT